MSNLRPTTGQSRMPWWLWINVLSLDAPLVAVLWQAALATAYGVRLPAGCYQVLWMAVWLIYILDRTLDGYSSQASSNPTARHAFYRKHRRLFLFGVIPVMTIVTAWLAFFEIPMTIMFRGVVLAFVVGLYLLHYAARSNKPLYIVGNVIACLWGSVLIWPMPILFAYKVFYTAVLVGLLVLAIAGKAPQSFRMIPKEFLCGYFFAIGSSLSVHFYTFDSFSGPGSLVTIMFALICALNCIIIACVERGTDHAGDPNAITRTWPWIPRYYPLLLLATSALGIYALQRHIGSELMVYSIATFGSLLLLWMLHHAASRLRPELSRVLADAALAVPMIVVLLLNL